MIKQLCMKATLHLLLLAMMIIMKYVHGARLLLTDDDTFPPVPPPETKPTNQIPTPIANAASTGVATVAPPTPSMVAATTFSFFMHDIFGGSAPSLRVVAGIIATNQATNGIPFSKPRGGIFPKSRGVPLIVTTNEGLNTGNNKNGKRVLPFVTAGQLPQGAAMQKLLFGTVTVIDDELTEGQELGSSIVGKAQGFYLASSMDGSSHTMAFTAMFHDEEDDDDAISFFGVHRTAARESHIAIVGGTGKYENAQGFAIIETPDQQTNQHTTDGIDTLLQFTVFITP